MERMGSIDLRGIAHLPCMPAHCTVLSTESGTAACNDRPTSMKR